MAPREPILAIGCEDSYVYVWDVVADRLQKLAGHRREGVRANWHPEGNLLSSVAWDNVLRLWDPFAAYSCSKQLSRDRTGDSALTANGSA